MTVLSGANVDAPDARAAGRRCIDTDFPSDLPSFEELR